MPWAAERAGTAFNGSCMTVAGRSAMFRRAKHSYYTHCSSCIHPSCFSRGEGGGWELREQLLNCSVLKRFGLFGAPGRFQLVRLHFSLHSGPPRRPPALAHKWCASGEKGPLRKKRVHSLSVCPPLSLRVCPLPSPCRGETWLDGTTAVRPISVRGSSVQNVSVFLEAHPLFALQS